MRNIKNSGRLYRKEMEGKRPRTGHILPLSEYDL
jgi:hypothetical protein